MRGKDITEPEYGHLIRITPAYAGKREPVQQPGNGWWDHPRVCGEKSY